MDVEAGLELVKPLITTQSGKPLNDLQIYVLQGALEGKTLSEIAEFYKYNESHVKDISAKLWTLLSNALGRSINKRNLISTLEQHLRLEKQKSEVRSIQYEGASAIPSVQNLNVLEGNGSRSGLKLKVEETTSKAPNSIESGDGNILHTGFANVNKHSSGNVTVNCSNCSDLKTRQRGVYIPEARCRRVWGRDDLTEKVLNYLTDPQESLRIFSLSGVAGYGKTEAARLIAEAALAKNLFADVLWVTARHTDLVDSDTSQEQRYEVLNWNKFLHEIAHQLCCPVDRVQQRLREEKLLVVLDNAETSNVEDILANLIKMLNPSRALLTSRLKTKPPYVKLIEIEGLESRWSYSLLREEAKNNNISILLQANESLLHRVHELSCGAPLALHFIVGRVFHDRALEPVLSELEQAKGKVEVFYQFTLETAWQRITNVSQDVLRYIGVGDAGILQAELSNNFQVLDSELNAALTELRRWYLLEDIQDAKGNRRYDLHPWVRRSVRGGLVEKWQPSLQNLQQKFKWKFNKEI